MRVLFALIALPLALVGCNGGEDFSDATVPGCPAGAPCDTSVRGEVFVELTGPKISNVGYKCSGSEVVFFTSDQERTTTDTDGEVVVIPPYTALCPAASQEIEFFLGNGLFEGNKITLGSFLFPQQIRKDSFQVTVADLILPPSRSSLDNSVLFRSALLQALDNDGDPDNEVSIQGRTPNEEELGTGVDINEVIDNNAGLIPSQPFDGYPDFAAFKLAWEDLLAAVDTALIGASKPVVENFDPDTSAYEVRILQAADRSRAGLYILESAGECLVAEECDFTAQDGSRFTMAMRGLVLPSGKVLAGGQLFRSIDSTTEELDFVGLQSTASVSDTLFLVNSDFMSESVQLTGAGIGEATPSVTDAQLQGRILGQTFYTGVTIGAGSDFDLDYPTTNYTIKSNEKGELAGTLLGRAVPRPDDDDPETIESPMPVRGTKTGEVEVSLDLTLLAAAEGDYRISLMRACVGEGDDGNGECSAIPNPTLEVGENYPDSITRGDTTVEIETERVREDEHDTPIRDFCLSIDGAGLITTGDNGACGTAHQVGMVTRTLPDSNSVNVFLRLAPGLDVRGVAPHYNVEIQGRIDFDDACAPMYRLGDANFDDKIRAGWVDLQFLPAIQRSNWSSQDNPTDLERLVFASLQSGAVQFAQDGCPP
ncbi:hypothetical protein MWU49_02530 [Alcanivorax sp. S6407]|uniref:hypothetical protein n=1 Tax=Alcanivorax sp. S6407 TaxID=2926424 RepID=UPI001FF5D8E4|nr:hypothetical protein [Alcanivorax sp. S6407]MCK0152568.1 hypothetical protein [Alcanivorax sp. S6407]